MYTKRPQKIMGRYREHFTLYARRRKNGEKIWYYKTYSPDGVRTCGKSTGLASKAFSTMIARGSATECPAGRRTVLRSRSRI